MPAYWQAAAIRGAAPALECRQQLLANINAETAAVVMVVMMMVVVMMVVRPPRDDAVIAVMVVMVMVMVVKILRELLPALRLLRGEARVICLQGIQRIRNRLQEVAIAGGRRALRRFRNGGLRGAHCRQRRRCAQKPGDLFIH
jgi:uncharacterized protein YggT (Ycf19 family)